MGSSCPFVWVCQFLSTLNQNKPNLEGWFSIILGPHSFSFLLQKTPPHRLQIYSIVPVLTASVTLFCFLDSRFSLCLGFHCASQDSGILEGEVRLLLPRNNQSSATFSNTMKLVKPTVELVWTMNFCESYTEGEVWVAEIIFWITTKKKISSREKIFPHKK